MSAVSNSSVLQALFNETTLGEVLCYRSPNAPRELVAVNSSANLHQALKAMVDKKVYSMPVINDANKKVVGVVDMLDVCRTLVQRLSEAADWRIWQDIKFSELLADVKVSEIVDFARGDPLLVCSTDSPVASIMKFFSSGLAHRCVVSFDTEKDYGIVSQVDVASWLASKTTDDLEVRKIFSEIPLIGELKNRASASHHVVSADWNDSVYDILRTMIKENVHAVALVDEKGKLQANFSATDIVHIDAAVVSDIKLPGKDYLKKYSKWSLTPLAIFDNEKSNLAESIMLFSGIGIHRIWLVDSPVEEKFSPTGVITVTDVLRIVHAHVFE